MRVSPSVAEAGNGLTTLRVTVFDVTAVDIWSAAPTTLRVEVANCAVVVPVSPVTVL